MQPTNKTIRKLYLSNFLSGLVFWYGIEKMFMQQINIDAVGIGIATAAYVGSTFLFDIPSGMIADRWSRKGLLILSSIFLAICSIILVTSTSLLQYVIGDIFFALFIAATSGTYQALTYDVLHEQGKSKEYSKIIGRSYAFSLIGAGIANIIGGLIAHFSNLSMPFWFALIPCLLNIVLLASVTEPTFHKKELKEKFLSQINNATRVILRIALLRSLLLIWCALGMSEIFKQDFSQLYMLQFTSSPIILGILWALYAFAWALGSFMAHYLQNKLNLLLIATLAFLIAISLTNSVWGLVFFMTQAFVAAAAFNLIETEVQHSAPSSVRASILSIMSSGWRLVMIPSSFLIGWLITAFDVFVAIKGIALVASMLLLYWLLVGSKRLKVQPISSYR